MNRVETVAPHRDGGGAPLLENGEAICLFAFGVRADMLRYPPADHAPEQRFALHFVGSVAALTGIVPIADYCGPDAERRLADAAWLAPRARRHAELVQYAMQRSPIFPAPFGTFYASVESLTAFMETHEATISGFLRDVADKEEWDLRACAQFDSPEILDQLACRTWRGWRDMSKGARYLRLCRDRNALLDFGRAEADAMVRDLISEIRPMTAAIRQHGAGRRSDSLGTEPVARYALLAPETAVAALRARVEELAGRAALRHVAIAMTGPLPAFSFRPDLTSAS